MLYCASNFRHYGVGAAGIVQTLAALSALPEDQLWFPAPPWRLTTVCNSSFRASAGTVYTYTCDGFSGRGEELDPLDFPWG